MNKTSLALIDRLLMLPHLRAIAWTLSILFCIAFWWGCFYLGAAAWELLAALFKKGE